MSDEERFGHGDNEVAAHALTQYGFSPQVTSRMINLSENSTYLIEDPRTGRRGILRVHRENYHPLGAIESELAWVRAVRQDSGIPTPVVVPTTDGRQVVSYPFNGTDRHAVLFEVMPGLEPDEVTLADDSFRTLGTITARLHEHARSWNRPPTFTRFAWDWEHSLGAMPRWGRWEHGIGIGPDERRSLQPAVDLIRQRLADYGQDPDVYGLVHADLRLANLLIDGKTVNVIDFDDCGFSWYMYDFGTAVSFIEDDPRLPSWQDAWLEGYREVRQPTRADLGMLATFVMLRRFLLVAWMGSHSHSRECQVKGPGYTAGTIDLAARYVASDGLSLAADT